MQEVHDQANHSDKERQIEQQQRCIRHIHFHKDIAPAKPVDSIVTLSDSMREKSESSIAASLTAGKVQRSSILKPTLVGKSVEGRYKIFRDV
jgi:hypothetical protein